MSTADGRPSWRQPSARDVAAAVGVSQSTVSLVLSGKGAGRVSENTSRRVLETAARLEYTPNRAARQLRSGTSKSIALLTPVLGNPFFAAVHDALARAADNDGMNVIVYPLSSSDGGVPLPPFNQSVDGIVGCSVDWHQIEHVASGIPTVLIDSDPDCPVTIVNADVEKGARALAAHLADQGITKAIHIAADVSTWTFRTRGSALRDEFAWRGMSLERHAVTPSTEATRVLVSELLAGHLEPLTVVCDTDEMALGAYFAASSSGALIPEQLSVVGFDDREMDRWLAPPLTSVQIDPHQLGTLAAKALQDVWQNPSPARLVVPAPVRVRQSVRKHRDAS